MNTLIHYLLLGARLNLSGFQNTFLSYVCQAGSNKVRKYTKTKIIHLIKIIKIFEVYNVLQLVLSSWIYFGAAHYILLESCPCTILDKTASSEGLE